MKSRTFLKKPSDMLAELKKRRRPVGQSRLRVRVGMATCGISAGAVDVYDEFIRAVNEAGLENVEFTATGCVGRCDLEPLAEVTRGADPPILYTRLDSEKVKRIVREHLTQNTVVEEYAV